MSLGLGLGIGMGGGAPSIPTNAITLDNGTVVTTDALVIITTG